MNHLRITSFVVAILIAVACQANAAEPVEDVLCGTYRVAGEHSSGTCFLVACGKEDEPRIALLTAAHVFEGMKSNARLIARVVKEDRTHAKREVPLTIRDADAPRWKKHPQLDIAALAVELPDGLDVTPFRRSQLAAEKAFGERQIRVAQDVLIPCYPVQMSSNEAGWPILRKGSIASHPLWPPTPAKTMLVDFSTFGGDSGAPVITPSGDGMLIVGMVLGMHRQSDKVSLPFEERTTHMPLGLSIVVQSPFLLETLDLLSQ
jgi:hypothetical protein